MFTLSSILPFSCSLYSCASLLMAREKTEKEKKEKDRGFGRFVRTVLRERERAFPNLTSFLINKRMSSRYYTKI